MYKKSLWCWPLALFLSLSSMVWAARKKPGKEAVGVEHLALAALLIRDGHLKRAAAILKEAEPGKKGFDHGRYQTLLGILSFKRRQWRAASLHFEKALSTGKAKPALVLFLARAYFQRGAYKKVLSSLQRAPRSIQQRLNASLMRIQAHWRLGERTEAFSVVVRADRVHPRQRVLLRLRILLLIELGLFQRATELGASYLRASYLRAGEAALNDYLAFAEGLRQARQLHRSILLLEEARLRFPVSTELLVRLARVYLEAKRPLSAASLLERAAWLKPSLTVEAAELYRRARKTWLALHLNARVPQQKVKIRQRLGLWIELRQFEKVVLLVPRLSRLGLLKDERILYALAYACFKTGRYQEAESWLKPIRSSRLFQKANVLRQAMQACAGDRQWWCP